MPRDIRSQDSSAGFPSLLQPDDGCATEVTESLVELSTSLLLDAFLSSYTPIAVS